MTVKELIEKLQKCNPDYVVHGRGFPYQGYSFGDHDCSCDYDMEPISEVLEYGKVVELT